MRLPRRTLPICIERDLTVEEVASRVAALHERRSDSYAGRRGRLARVSRTDTGVDIYLHRIVGRNLGAEIRAVVRTHGGGSLVEGTAAVSAVAWFLPFVVGSLMVVVFAVGFSAATFTPLMWLGFAGALLSIPVLLAAAASNRNRLIADLKGALGRARDTPPAQG